MNGVKYKNLYCLVFLGVIANFIYADCPIKIFRYGYTTQEQTQWKNNFPTCGGDAQSPIAIFQEIVEVADLPDLEMVGYHTGLKAVSWIYNDGYSVRRRIPANYQEKPFIFTRNGDAYDIVEFHFHWGAYNNRGSEHVINDVYHPMEMHIVHKRRSKKDIFQTMDDKQGFVVLAFFFQIRTHSNPGIQQFVDALQYVRNPNTSYWDRKPFTLASMLGDVDLETYYTYNGSFTTPPCYESVRWYLFPDPIAITEEQLGEFRKLRGWNRPLVDNFRFVQKNTGYKVQLKLPRNKLINEENPEESMPCLEFLTPEEEAKIKRGSGTELVRYLQMPFSRALIAKYSYNPAEDHKFNHFDGHDLHDHIDVRANINSTSGFPPKYLKRQRRHIKLPVHIKSLVEQASDDQIKEALGKLTDSLIAIKAKKSLKEKDKNETKIETRSESNKDLVSKNDKENTKNFTTGEVNDKGSKRLFDAIKNALQSSEERGKSPVRAPRDPGRLLGRRSGSGEFGFRRFGFHPIGLPQFGYEHGHSRFGIGRLLMPPIHHY